MKQSNYISRNKQYIDYRINQINESIGSSENNQQEILFSIISYLTDTSHNSCLSILPKDSLPPIYELKSLISKWDFYKDGDIIGYIYQSIENQSSLKKKGQFFTPNDIVVHLVDTSCKSIDLCNAKILDPACGSGQFLISVFKYLFEYHTNSGMPPSDASQHIIDTNIFGTDIDPIAVMIARFNLMKLSGCSIGDIKIHCTDFLYHDDLNISGNEFSVKSFDLIIGNPPWRSKFTIDEKKYFRKHYGSIQSGVNTFTLFLERSFDYIHDNGTVSFLIPEAYLNIKAHRSSRNYILNNAKIKGIDIWGERFKGVFAPSVSVVLEKEFKSESREKNIVHIRNAKNQREGTSILVPQATYYKTHENIFNINHTRKAVNIITTIDNQNCFYLKDRAKFFLGIVTGNNQHYISSIKTDETPDPIIIGKDVQQYSYNFSNHYFKYNPETLQQVAPKNLYLSKNKILYKFIGKKLTFAVDRNGYYILNNVNGIIPLFDNISIDTAVSVLNSKIMQYYYQNNFFTIKVLRGNLERLPIKMISKDTQKKIRHLTQNIMNSNTSGNTQDRESIEDLIFHEYGIQDKDAHYIYDSLN